jgi:kanamycin kinase
VRDAEFFAAYGVEPDLTRMDYYRRLWQAGDDTSR